MLTGALPAPGSQFSDGLSAEPGGKSAFVCIPGALERQAQLSGDARCVRS